MDGWASLGEKECLYGELHEWKKGEREKNVFFKMNMVKKED